MISAMDRVLLACAPSADIALILVLVVGEEVPAGEHHHFAAAEINMPIEPTSFEGVDEVNHQLS
jgi:hypothetical protein